MTPDTCTKCGGTYYNRQWDAESGAICSEMFHTTVTPQMRKEEIAAVGHAMYLETLSDYQLALRPKDHAAVAALRTRHNPAA